MNKVAKPGKPFYTIIALFTVFLLVVCGVCLFISLNAITTMGEQARNSMLVALEVNMAYINEQREKTSLADLAASLDRDGLLTKMSFMSTLDPKDIKEMGKRLEILQKTFPDDSLIFPYIYFQRSDYALGCEAPGTDVREVIGSLIFENVESLPPWTRMYSDTHLLNQESSDPIAIRAQLVGQNVYFLYVTHGKPITVIPSQLLDSLCQPEMYYYDRHGNVGPCQEETSLMHLYDYYSLGNTQSGSFSFTHEGVVYNCIYDQVPDSETKFAIFAIDQAHQAKQTLLRSVFILIGFMLLLGIVVVIVFARKMYKPIQTLVGKLEYEDKDGIRDDFYLLEEALQAKDNAIASQEQKLKRATLLRLLQGHNVIPQESKDDFFFYNDKAPFAVVAFRTESIEQEKVIKLDPGNVEEIFHANYIEAICTYDGQLMLCVFDPGKRDMNALTAFLEDLRTKIGEKANTTVSAFLSDIHRGGPEALRTAYVEVLQLADFCGIIEKYDTVLNYQTMRKHLRFNCGNVLDYSLLSKLSSAITDLNEEDALVLFERIAQRITLCKETSHPVVALCLSTLRNSIALALHEVSLYGETMAKITSHYEQEILLAGTLQRLREVLKEALEELSEHAARLKSDSGRFEEINSYVMEHYLEPFLTAGAVADAFGMSPSNVTRLYKKYKHMGFLEYVNMLRVEKAKTLLRSTDYTLDKISELVGYTNTVTMTRAFKRCTGTTPGNFRNEAMRYE